ncbi:hypothetical protein ACFOOK_16205 [Micromonospora krabiensis]|uniref:Uncharacterized protein n=1 Tax=Micromonospora krabiensis TaxID=307121 RepID=A0A1C3N098_9ACTN|nr:hypothetical protein [Micromonospora krabiensis]SBV26013.1 hypothetical protein GA0070620_1495 [Micromonospora krabiensis]
MASTSDRRRASPLGQAAGALVVALLSATSWYAWLGWDTGYRVDPVTGATSGPYEVWQVVGCALTLLVVLVGALLAGVRPVLASAALTLAFTAAWTAAAASRDDSGLYAVGAVLLLVGLAVGTAVVAAVVRAVRPGR